MSQKRSQFMRSVKGNPISVRLDLNRSSDSSRFSQVRGKFTKVYMKVTKVYMKLILVTKVYMKLILVTKVYMKLILVLTLMLMFYIICLKTGACSFFWYFLSKVGGSLGVKALSFFLVQMGCPATLAFVIGCGCRALVTPEASPSLARWMLPGPSHQPHVAEEVPQEGLQDQTVAIRSAPPVGIEVKQPLMGDQQRHEELSDRLNRHFFGHSEKINLIASDDLIEKQALIERKLELALLSEEYTRERILLNRYEIRELIFYKDGVPLKEKTLDLYLKQIQSSSYQSVPYKKILKAIKNFDIFFSK
jgi:hypothetical protein